MCNKNIPLITTGSLIEQAEVEDPNGNWTTQVHLNEIQI